MQHLDLLEYCEKEKPRELVLLHHWDTDGLATARLFLNFFEQRKNTYGTTTFTTFLPTINNYFLTEPEYAALERTSCEAILVLDFNIPPEVIERLESTFQHVFVFDHHSQTARIDKPGVQNPNYAGCSLLVADYLIQPLSLLSVLGAVGDQEEQIRSRPDVYPQIEQVMEEDGLSFDELLRITKLIDTSYIVGTQTAMAHAIEALRDPKNALRDAVLVQQEADIRTDYERECAKEMRQIDKHVLSMSIVSPFSLISEVTRAKSRQHPNAVVVTDHVRGDMASVYVRRRTAPIDLGCVVDMARAQGFNAGGKPEVAGVVLPTAALEQFREQIFELLRRTL